MSDYRKHVSHPNTLIDNTYNNDIISSTFQEYNTKPYYSQLKPVFEEMVASLRSQKECDTCKDLMEKITFEFINKKKSPDESKQNNELKQTNDSNINICTFLGEHNNSKQKIETRTKYKHERYCSKKRKRI